MPDSVTWTPSPIQPMRPLPPNSPSPAPILKQASSWKLGEEEKASEGGEEEDPEEEDAVIDECLEVVCHGDDPVVIDSGDETVLSPDPKNKKKDNVNTMDDSYWRVEDEEMGQDLKEHDAKEREMKKDSETGENLQPPAKKSKQLKETPEATTSCLKSEGPKPEPSSNLEETPAQLAAKQQQLEDALQSEDEPVDRKTAFKVGGWGVYLIQKGVVLTNLFFRNRTFIIVVYCTVLILIIYPAVHCAVNVTLYHLRIATLLQWFSLIKFDLVFVCSRYVLHTVSQNL